MNSLPIRNALALLLGLLLGGAATWASAIGNSIDGHCYGTEAEAITTFQKRFPVYDNSHLYSLSDMGKDTMAGYYWYTIFYSTDWGVYVYENGNVFLPICSNPSGTFDKFKSNDVVFFSVLFFAFAAGFSASYKS